MKTGGTCAWLPLATALACLIFFFPAKAETPDENSLGRISDTPYTQFRNASLEPGEPERTFSFSLEVRCKVTVTFTVQRGRAALTLRDAGNAVLARLAGKSPSTAAKLTLEPGGYLLVLTPGSSTAIRFTFSIAAEFVPRESLVSDQEIQDPEYDLIGSRAAWRTAANELHVAPIDPETGQWHLGETEHLDDGLAPYDEVINGPEWVWSAEGSRIVYTKSRDGAWSIHSAKLEGGNWVAAPVEGAANGYRPIGSKDPEGFAAMIKYSVETSTARDQADAWQDLNPPFAGGEIPESPNIEAGQWIPGQRRLIVSRLVGSYYQLAVFDPDAGSLTNLTTDPSYKLVPYVINAPEFGNSPVITAFEQKQFSDRGSYDGIGVYREINGQWTRIKTIVSPDQNVSAVQSAEPFVMNGKTYVSFLALNPPGAFAKRRKAGSQVWIASIDPARPFLRRVSGAESTIVRSDPEPFATELGAFIFYTQLKGGQRYIRLAETGLVPGN